MDGIQAAVLSVKLRRLAAANAARRANAELYDQFLADEARVVRPTLGEHNLHAFHIYAVRVQDRDGVLQRMAARGVNCAIHYPVPIHLQKAYSFLRLGPGSFPVAERCAQEFLSLPMYPELRPEQIKFVVEALKESLRNLSQ
jgi:dTDP-4-amino-4,6-dideoxygalactose transaminase